MKFLIDFTKLLYVSSFVRYNEATGILRRARAVSVRGSAESMCGLFSVLVM
jgi:hypothetical protein